MGNASTGLGSLAGALTTDGGGQADLLVLDDQDTTAGHTYGISASGVTRDGTSILNFSGFTGLTLNASDQADTINVASTASGLQTTVNGEGGLDTFGAINQTTIGASGLAVNGGGQGETLTLNGGSVAETIGVGASQVIRSDGGPVNYAGLTSLTVNGTSQADTINITGSAASVATTINAGGGLDTFGAINQTAIGVALTVSGGGQGETLTLNGGSVAETIGVSGSQVTRSDGGTVSYSGVASLTVSGPSTAIGDIFAVTPSASTTINIIGGLPTPPASPGDALSVNLAGTTTPTLTGNNLPSGLQGSYTFGNRQPVNFQQIEKLTPAPDLAVAATETPNPVVAGANLSYTLTLSNLGDFDAQTVTLTDAAPANTTFISFTQTSGPTFTLSSPPVGGTGNATANIAVLAAGQSATFTLVVRANTGLANNTPITNIVAAATATPESPTTNNTATTVTKVGPVAFLAVGAEPGDPPRVAVFSRAGAPIASFLAYAASFKGGVRVAVGDVNGDGTADIITAGGQGARARVQVIDGSKLALIPVRGPVPAAALLGSFFAYQPGFTGGVFVAAGDVNGDGRDDVITGAGNGSAPRVKVIDGTKVGLHLADGRIAPAAHLGNFLAYPATFGGGVTVGAGDVNGDGRADVLAAPAGGAQRVEVIDGTRLGMVVAGRIANAALLARFFALPPAFAGGVFVAAGDVNGDGRADVVIGPASSAAPVLKVIDATRLNLLGAGGQISSSALLANQLVFARSFHGGLRVGAMDVDTDGLAEILVGTGPNKRKIFGLDVLGRATKLDLTLGLDAASLGGI